MIPFQRFKNLLGRYADNLSDEEVELIRTQMYQIADMAFDIWAKEKSLGIARQVRKVWYEVVVKMVWVEV